MFTPGPSHSDPSPYGDDWEDQPTQGWFYQWVLGVALPVAMVGHGVSVLSTGVLVGEHGFHLHGLNARAAGAAFACAGIFVHCHYFWGNVYNQVWWAVLGKILSAMGFIAALAILLVRIGVLGVR